MKQLRAHTQRAGWSAAEFSRACMGQSGGGPLVEFEAEAEHCGVCGTRLQVQKTRRRRVSTLVGGEFVAREVIKCCPRERDHPVCGSAALNHLVPAGSRYGYDVVVYAGLARYLRGQQRVEIQAALRERYGVVLSTGTLSSLCDRFLRHLQALHTARAPALQEAMSGGYPLHLDATCEAGKGGLLVCLDGWRGWVLVAGRIPTENVQHIQPLIEATVKHFGEPVATVRDLNDSGAHAVAALRERGVPDLVCHFHFLGAVARQLFEAPYRLLRKLLRASRLRRDLHELLGELRRYRRSAGYAGRFGVGAVREDLLALVLWVVEGDGKKDIHYPFSLPHLNLVQRAQTALHKAESWVALPRTAVEQLALKQLRAVLRRLERESRLPAAVLRLEKAWLAFCELREVLQLTNAELPGPNDGERQARFPEAEAERLQAIEAAVNAYRETLTAQPTDPAGSSVAYPPPSAVILKYLHRYGPRLFGHPTRRNEDGAVLAVVERTNNVAEGHFGREKQKLRRRVGRAHLGRDMDDQPAQAALTANLAHVDYVRVLCGSLDHLPEAFAELEAETLAAAGELSRTSRNTELNRRIKLRLGEERIAARTEPTARSDVREELPATEF